ncbi:MAG: hypothetical protein IJX90_07915, partial [Blautia sp.]|nr:hypothetical protein [Blautia sp.]
VRRWRMNMEIICDKCGAVIPNPEWKTIRDGEIEHTYYECPDCGEAYRISTTDKALRKRIDDYTKMAARLKKGRCTEAFHRRVQKLKETNVKRSRELGKDHPLAPLLLQK